MKKIFITRRIPYIAYELLKKYFDVEMHNENTPLAKEDLIKVIEEYDGILSCVSEKFSREILEKKRNLQVISNYAVGLDNIDLNAAKDLGISV